MSQITIQNLTFAYDGSYENIFEKLDLRLDTDWKLGLIGRNGKGKTTLLRLLSGHLDHDGSIVKPVATAYFPYPVKDPALDTLEIVAEICPNYAHWELLREMNHLSLDEELLYRPFDTLSGGERTRLLLAVLFLKENRFLLIDEPTDHLDIEGREIVARYLDRKKGFILVSHDRAFLDSCVDHILAINRSGLELMQGNFSTWWANNEKREQFELAENKKLKSEIKRLEASANEKASWSLNHERAKYGGDVRDRGFVGAEAARMMKRSKNLEKRQRKAIEDKKKLLKNLEHSFPLKLSQLDFHTQQYVSLSDISIRYDDRIICDGVTFFVEKGDKLSLIGKNGSGKSSILKLICGEDIPHDGCLVKHHQLKISYVSQDTSELSGSLNAYAKAHGIDGAFFKSILQKLNFDPSRFETPLEAMSLGQQKKVLLARSLSEKSHLLIWDEPLNYIDVISRIQIERLLSEHELTVLFVEHDRAFCEKIANKTVMLTSKPRR